MSCESCVTNKRCCVDCRENPIYAETIAKAQEMLNSVPKYSQHMYYKPVCPYGATDCVCDPAYIKYYYPDWYADSYGDKTPEEAIYVKNGCYDHFINDPKHNYCYDDEDK